jgi:hypothetical protein
VNHWDFVGKVRGIQKLFTLRGASVLPSPSHNAHHHIAMTSLPSLVSGHIDMMALPTNLSVPAAGSFQAVFGPQVVTQPDSFLLMGAIIMLAELALVAFAWRQGS